jgi:hypothetical protein
VIIAFFAIGMVFSLNVSTRLLRTGFSVR